MKRITRFGEMTKLSIEEKFYELIDEINSLEHRGVRCYIIQPPLKEKVVNLSDFEKERLEKWEFDYGHISSEDCQIIKRVYTDEIDLDYLYQVYDGTKVFEKKGIKYLANYKSEFVNIISGERVTYYQPESFNHSVFLFGQCTVRGNGVEDKNTIASFLQNKINQKFEKCYKIHNCGIGCGSDIHDEIAHLRKKTVKSGDIVIFCTNLVMIPDELFIKRHVKKYDSSFLFDRPHNYAEWFTDDTFHTTPEGNRVIADYIYEILMKDNILNKNASETMDTPIYVERQNILCDREELEEYLEMISQYRHDGMKCGCIVMGANPFTNGHLYLIETAAKNMDWLYIFVVEENRFFFDFETRINLVKSGTKHLKNVTVLPSGKLIISAVTFPGYFNKDDNTDIQVDTSLDVAIFGKYIAPELAIRVRFVGEEPIDFVTNQYNKEMQEILPEYGIEVCEIKRKEVQGKVISASTVRELLNKKSIIEIKDLVPITTYDYLVKKYG